MSLIRVQRLTNDERELRAFLEGPGAAHCELMESEGRPADRFRLLLKVPGVVASAATALRSDARLDGALQIRDQHRVDVQFPADHPFRPPVVVFLDGLFHPNVYPTGRLCWGIADTDRTWWRGGEGFPTLIERLLHLIVGRRDCVNPNSPAQPVAVPVWTAHAARFPLLEIPPLTTGPETEGGAA